MKKIALLSAVLVLMSSPGFATSNSSQQHWQGFSSESACQAAAHSGICVQRGSNWYPSHQPSSSTTATTGTSTTPVAGVTAPSTMGTAAPKAPLAPTSPTPPASITAAPPTTAAAPAAQSSGSSFWPFGKSKATPTTTNNNDEASSAEAKKPVDPHQVAKGKVWGSQGDCQGNTGGHCVATDCSTHLGGVCEGTKGVVWSYTPK